MTTRAWMWVAAAAWLVAALPTANAEPRRVLLLHSFGRDFSPYHAYLPKLRRELTLQSSQPIDLYEASFATARFADGEREGPFVDYLDSLFADRRLDLMITIGGPAASFLQRHRHRLFPSTPVLFSAVDQRFLREAAALSTNDAAVAVRIELPTLVENILTVLPRTRRIVVVHGDSALERFWAAEMRREFQQFASRVTFTWLNDLPFSEVLRRVARLPPHSAILLGHVSVDAAGVPHEGETVITELHAAANAPIFSYVDSHFGHGLVGGPLISLGEVGRAAATAAVRILRGEPAGTIKTAPIGFAAPVFDWRELRRWDISPAQLPAGSIVRFREATTWERYKWYILSAVAFGGLQGAFILALLVNRRRLRRANLERLRAEEAAQELSGQLLTAQEEERSRLAHELHDDISQRLALLAIDAGREERKSASPAGNGAMRAIRKGLVRLSTDVHALSYRLHPSILDDLGLVEALRAECERFSQTYPIRVEASFRDIPEKVPFQVALSLFRIAQEALRNIARHSGASRAEIRLEGRNGELQLLVRDNGTGFDPREQRSRPSLGRAGMRQRVHLLGGKLDIASTPGHGTEILARVPLQEECSEPTARAAG